MDRQRSITDFFSQKELTAVQSLPTERQVKKRRLDTLNPGAPNNDSEEQIVSESSIKSVCTDSDSISDKSENRPLNTRISKVSAIQLDDLKKITDQYQPIKSFVFPKQTTGLNRNRSVQHQWFQNFKWLHYDIEKDALLCFTCIKGCTFVETSINDWCSDAEMAFIKIGYTNWKDAISRLSKHEKSHFHLKCVHLISKRENSIPINAQLQQMVLKNQSEAQICLRAIISSLRYLTLSGSAIRGNDSNEGNLVELLQERQSDIPELGQWMQKRDNYLSPQIQNELIEIMAHEVQRSIAQEIRCSPWYSIIVDGTTDISGEEQISICVRFVNPDTFAIRELFLGMYNTDDSRAMTIATAIKDVLLRLNLSLDNLRGYAFDGAANMSGCHKGVRTILTNEQPKSIYVHCSNHSLDLVLQEIAKNRNGVSDALCLVKDSSNTILRSAKRKKLFDNVVIQPCDNNSIDSESSVNIPTNSNTLLSLCPTRWVARVNPMKRYKKNYKRVQKTLQEIHDNSTVSNDKKSSIRGWMAKLNKSETLFYLNVSITIFAPCEEVARALQNSALTVTGAKRSIDMLIGKLEDLRNESSFNKIFDSTLAESKNLKLDPLKEPRARRPPKHYFDQIPDAAPHVQLAVKDLLRTEYYAILDLQLSELNDRFNQEGFETLVRFETILLDATNGIVPEETVLREDLNIFAEDFDVGRLHTQLQFLGRIPGINVSTCAALGDKLASESSTVKTLLDQVALLLVLVNTIPASAASAERSFSALRRVKTYLRSVMSQKRLTHVLLLHIHKHSTTNLDLNHIMRLFVSKSDERKKVFGKV